MMEEVGLPLYSIPGPEFWLLPNGNTIYPESKLVEKEQAPSGNGALPAGPVEVGAPPAS